MSPEEYPTWREVHTLMDNKVLQIRQEQDGRYRDVDGKLDRNSNDVRTLERTLTAELIKIRELLAEAKDELASSKGVAEYKQWVFPVLISVIVGIIEVVHIFVK